MFEQNYNDWIENQLLKDHKYYYEINTCPVCGNISEPYFEVGRFEYLNCMCCNTIFEKQRPTKIGLEIIYNSVFSHYWRNKVEIPLYKSNGIERYSMPFKTLKALENQLFRYVDGKKNSLLDYACGLGVISDYYYKTGKFGKVYYYEINRFAIEFITNNFKNIKLFNGIEKVDAIILYAALEHFPEPLEILKEITKYLKPNGILQIFIPYMGIITRKYFPNMYRMINSGLHLNYFSEKGMKILGESLNLEVQDIIYTGHNSYYLINYIYHKKAYHTCQMIYDDKLQIVNMIPGYYMKNKFYNYDNISNPLTRYISKAVNRTSINKPLKIIDKGAFISVIYKKIK